MGNIGVPDGHKKEPPTEETPLGWGAALEGREQSGLLTRDCRS
jgi:hypothetical protein